MRTESIGHCGRRPRDHIVAANLNGASTSVQSRQFAHMAEPLFRGVLPALVTPFRDGAVDEDAFVRLVERQIAGGVHGLVPVGTTGESATLSHDEHRRVVELCVKTAAGRVPVIAGTGSNSTTESIELTRHARQVGADAVLAVAGYYNRPSQEGLNRHFEAL